MRSCVWLSRCCRAAYETISPSVQKYFSFGRDLWCDESLLMNLCWWPRSTCRPIYRSTVKVLFDRLSVDRRPIFDRYLTDTSLAVNRYISSDASAVSRSIYRSTIGRLSVDYRSTIGRLSADTSVDCRPICRPRPPIVHMIRSLAKASIIFKTL